jgi:hypothetical protein
LKLYAMEKEKTGEVRAFIRMSTDLHT